MAYYNNNLPDEGKVSEWNSAQLKMRRLDDKITLLNNINGNLWGFNMDYGIYNFELHFKTCKTLYAEVDSKLTQDEKVRAKVLKEKIQIFLEEYPVIKIIRSGYNKTATKKQIHFFKVLEVMLEELELMVREFIDVHGMDTAYGDEEALF